MSALIMTTKKSISVFGALLCLVAAGCADVGDALAGKEYGPLTAGISPDLDGGAFVPVSVEDPDVRAAAGVAVARVSPGAALTRIFSAEQFDSEGKNFRMQMELTDRSVWEAIVNQSETGKLELLRLERVG